MNRTQVLKAYEMYIEEKMRLSIHKKTSRLYDRLVWWYVTN